MSYAISTYVDIQNLFMFYAIVLTGEYNMFEEKFKYF